MNLLPDPAGGLSLPTIALVGADSPFLNSVAAALGSMRVITPAVLKIPIEQALGRPELDVAAVIVVDIDSKRRESLVALQGLMAHLGGRAPVIALTESFDDALARWFLQVRVADFLRKPVDAKEVLRACVRALRATSEMPGDQGQIFSFMGAAGGVGNTTLAIETSMLLLRESKEENSTCLVDLDFRSGACVDYLDMEPRLDIDEIGPHPERLDLQLLEVMLNRHSSGLSLLAAKGHAAQAARVEPAFVTRLLDLVSSRFENVIIDLPRSWERWTDQVLLGSNRVYVVSDMTVPGLRLGRRLAAGLAARLPEVKPRVIVNRFEQQRLFGGGLRRVDVERALEGFLEGTVANNYKLVREAIDRGIVLDGIKASSNVSTDLKNIVLAHGGGS
jgi:pilus assembly protein CpaE